MPARSATTETLLEIDDVHKTFGGVQAVSGCSFSLRRGAITGLIGPNGAGKTTLFNIIAGAFAPTAGQIRFQGEPIAGLAAHRLFHKGIVRTFQIPHEFGRMTCLENLMLVPPGQHGEGLFGSWLGWRRVVEEETRVRDRALAVLEFLEMAHLHDTLASRVSGGQKKLLEIGRTMMTEAQLVLLDEPGAGVNRTLLGNITRAIRRLNEERGYSFCIIEHDMSFIAELCDPVVCMAEGRVLTMGSMDEVKCDPRVLEAYLGHSTAGGVVA